MMRVRVLPQPGSRAGPGTARQRARVPRAGAPAPWCVRGAIMSGYGGSWGYGSGWGYGGGWGGNWDKNTWGKGSGGGWRPKETEVKTPWLCPATAAAGGDAKAHARHGHQQRDLRAVAVLDQQLPNARVAAVMVIAVWMVPGSTLQ